MIQSQSRDRSRIFLIGRSTENLTNFKEMILRKKIRTRNYIIQTSIEDKSKIWIHFGCPNCNEAIVGKEIDSNYFSQIIKVKFCHGEFFF